MDEYRTLIDALRAQRDSEKSICIIDGEHDETVITYRDLWRRAAAVAADLQNRGAAAGDELVIVTKSAERFLVAFWGAVLAGVVPVPVAVGISDEHRLKLFRIIDQLRAPHVFTDDDLLARLTAFADAQDKNSAGAVLSSRAFTELADADDTEMTPHAPDAGDIAFVQYSSGSTSDPKGVCLTHRNVTSTVAGQLKGLAITEADSTFSWMPLTHDMGLIGYHLSPLAAGVDHYIMDTAVFVRRPLLWLQKVSEYRATILCSPNFGYKHFLKVFERKQPDGLELSCVRCLLNGAEPISLDLCYEFQSALGKFGLSDTAMLPVYGLAEATLAVTFPELDKPLTYVTANRHRLRIGDAIEHVADDHADAMRFVRLGTPIDGCDYRVVDDNDQPLPAGAVGNIQLSGDNITRGIYRDEERTREIIADDGWLRTGDCGATVDDELIITGRSKDIIIVNGQNYYPHDIEEIIAEHDELELGKVVVGGVKRAGRPTEELLVFVLHRQDPQALVPLVSEIRELLGSRAALEIDRVVPVSRIPKTTSGKIQRSLLIESYLDGEFDTALQSLEVTDVNDDDGHTVVEEKDPIVAELLAIAAEFAKDRDIGPDDNLFEVGLTSLTLAEIMLALDEKYPASVDINDLFDHPTIRELAGFLATKNAA